MEGVGQRQAKRNYMSQETSKLRVGTFKSFWENQASSERKAETKERGREAGGGSGVPSSSFPGTHHSPSPEDAGEPL